MGQEKTDPNPQDINGFLFYQSGMVPTGQEYCHFQNLEKLSSDPDNRQVGILREIPVGKEIRF